MHRLSIINRLSILLLVALFTACDSENENRIYQKTSPHSFEETLWFLDTAIAEHNYRIIHRSAIGQAIRDRGDKDFPLSTITSFCNITYAKDMMMINPDLINDMPCHIAVREQDDAVIVSTQLMDWKAGNTEYRQLAEKINHNLISIINSTVE